MSAAGAPGQNPDTDAAVQQSSFWHRFTQQRLKAWQPILAPTWIISIYFACGFIFLGIGVILLLTSWSITELRHDYTAEDLNATTGVGSFEFTVGKDMESPIWVYYELDGFHQNHRRYVKSTDDEQMRLADKPKLTEAELSDCKPWVKTGDRINYPCGLVARSVFNDTYVILKNSGEEDDDHWEQIGVDTGAKTIAWAADTDGKYQNLDPEAIGEGGQKYQELLNMWIVQRFPPVECVQKEIRPKGKTVEEKPYDPVFVATKMVSVSLPGGGTKQVEVVDCTDYKKGTPTCNFVKGSPPVAFDCTGDYETRLARDWGIENGHFIVWMRIAGLPVFRKLWGRLQVDEPVKKGTRLKVYFKDNFPVKEYQGRKALVISTSTSLGGRNDFLGYGYIVVGGCCLVFGIAFVWGWMTQGTRALGDISLLLPSASS